jgi:hypothetical protein
MVHVRDKPLAKEHYARQARNTKLIDPETGIRLRAERQAASYRWRWRNAENGKERGQVCEANFYGGELALRQGAKETAVR